MIASFSVVTEYLREVLSDDSGTAYPLPFYPGKIEGFGSARLLPLTPVETVMSIEYLRSWDSFFILGLKY